MSRLWEFERPGLNSRLGRFPAELAEDGYRTRRRQGFGSDSGKHLGIGIGIVFIDPRHPHNEPGRFHADRRCSWEGNCPAYWAL